MRWEFIVALVVAIPIILLPVAFLWYLNASGLYRVIRDRGQQRRSQAGHQMGNSSNVEEQPTMTSVITKEHSGEGEPLKNKQ